MEVRYANTFNTNYKDFRSWIFTRIHYLDNFSIDEFGMVEAPDDCILTIEKRYAKQIKTGEGEDDYRWESYVVKFGYVETNAWTDGTISLIVVGPDDYDFEYIDSGGRYSLEDMRNFMRKLANEIDESFEKAPLNKFKCLNQSFDELSPQNDQESIRKLVLDELKDEPWRIQQIALGVLAQKQDGEIAKELGIDTAGAVSAQLNRTREAHPKIAQLITRRSGSHKGVKKSNENTKDTSHVKEK